MRGFKATTILVLLIATGVEGFSAPPEPGEGPFEERNQFPINLLFLALPVRGGDLLPAGGRELSISQTYANTYVGSDAIFDVARATSGRIHLTEAVVGQAQTAQPEESLYFVDTESARTEIRFRAAMGSWFEAGFEIPMLSYRGGAFDSVIESYHQGVGLGNANREHFVRDAVQLAVTMPGGGSYFTDRTPSLYQLGDAALSGRIALHRSEKSRLALSGMLKFPTGDAATLGGSGKTDFGLGVEWSGGGARHRVHLAGQWVHPGGWSLFPDFHAADVRGASAAWEFHSRDRVSWIGQLQFQSSALAGADGVASDLEQPSVEVLGGLRWRGERERWFFEAAFIENVFNQDNGVDSGLRAGAGYRFGGR